MSRLENTKRSAVLIALILASMVTQAQDAPDAPKPVPVFSGSFGFVPIFDGGHVTLVTLASPVVLVPIGDKWLVESRGAFEGDFTRPDGGGPFGGKVNKEVEYLQLDYIANPYMTVTGGRFLNPFGIYNERLYPVWIRNLQTDPLILPLEGDSRDGLMLRGGIPLSSTVNLNYTTFFSTESTINKLESDRAIGGRFGFFFPAQRLELGASVQHALVDDRSNKFGFHFEQQPLSLPLDIRVEYAHGVEGSGYWIEPAYKLSQVPFLNSVMRKTQIVARYQQFYIGNGQNQALPSADMRIFEDGLNYYIRDGLKATASYGRQFSTAGNANVWTVGLAYRWVLPLGRGGVR
jgi:hypothetical protein